GTLAPSTSCTIDVAFTPGAAGARTATLQVESNASTSPDGVDLSGTGIAANPEIDVSPASLDFGNWPVGTISTTQSVTVTNGGNVSLTITGVSAVGDNSGDFALVSNDCAATLAPGDACTLSFNFTPVAGGARSAGEIVETDDPCASATIAVSGTGLAPEVTLAPTSLAFGNQKVGTTSAALTVTLTNSGNATLTGITLAASSGYLIESTSCAATLAAGADCTIDVSFTPSAPGADNGTLAVTSNASSSPDTVALTGTGTAPAVSLNPAALDFGSLAVGTSSAVETLTVMNSGNAVLDFNGAASVTGADAGDFAIVADSCGATLAMNASCTIGVTFTPGAVGARAASLAIPSDAPAPSPQAAPLTGTGTDNPPVAENGSLSTTTNVAANGTLVATDSDPNQTLSYLIISQPANGAVAITDTHTGAYTYTPGTNFAGTTSFTFKASDGYLDSTTATVTITVTDNPPTASDGTNSTTTNVAVDGQLVAQANNPGQTLTYRVISGAGHGMVTVNEATGAYTYMPATGFAGTDGFTFKANDGNEDSNTATITLTVADLPPIAHDGSAATTTNVPVDGQLTATNPDGAGQTLAFQIVAAPASGSVAVNAGTGAFSYSPKPGFAGSDHFTFRVFDGYLYSNVATVTITVTDIPPVASDGSVSTTVNKSAEGQLKAVAKNPGQILSYHVVAAPASGTVTVNAATGAFTYTPSEDFVGTDHFTFKANDGNEDSNVATETITVTNTPPVAENGSATLDANTSFSGQLQASDADPGQSLTYHAVGQPAHGKLTVNATTGAYSYTPKHNYAGADSFTFKANDGIGDSNVATVTITVNQGGLAVRGGPGGSGGFGLFGLLGLLLLAALLLLRRGGRHPTLPASPLPLAGGGNARGILRVGARPCSENHPPAPPFSHRPQQGGGTLFAIAAALLIFMLAGGNALAAGNTGNAWYVGGEANVIKTDSDRNVATHGFKGWGLYAGKELGRFSLEFNAAYHSDYPKSLSAAANWVTYGVNGLWFFAGRRNAAFSPFALAGAGLMRQYRGDNSEFWSGYDALGIGFTSRPWSAPLRLRVALQFQATFAGNYGDFVAAIGIEIPFGG
ncbi:MAG: beta strand repeat-containing protein, partial [Gammaproteobacteria bacterium]